MKLRVARTIVEKYNLFLGVVVARVIDNSKGEDFFTDELLAEERRIREEFKDKKLGEIPQIKKWREAYSSFGAKPKKYKSSIEALCSRILDGETLPAINPLVNIYNYVSIKRMVPVGGDDLNEVEGNIRLTFASGNERFTAIGGTETRPPKPGEIVYTDKKEILCRRWNWRECEKTKLTDGTTETILYVESLNDKKEAAGAVEELAGLIKENLGGEVSTYILTGAGNELDLEKGKLLKSDFDVKVETSKEELKKQEKGKKAKGKKIQKPGKIEFYHWADKEADKIIRQKGHKDVYVVAAGITPSGTIHMGNFREIITQDLVKRALEHQGHKVKFIYSWDDYDVFRKVPANMPNQEELKKHLRKSIASVPDPFGCHESYARHNETEVEEDVPIVGIDVKYLQQSKIYKQGTYDKEIKKALENTDKIKEILNKYRKEPLEEDWLPIAIFCPKCGKDTVKTLKWHGEYEIEYECECGARERIDFKGKGFVKLKWRADWPMRWHYYNEDFESAGKDHFASGGSVVTSREIQRAVWGTEPPLGVAYEWISIKGGKQFASSAGVVITLKEMLEVYQPEVVRYLFASTRPNADFAISFDADVIKIYEDFDRCERIYFGLENVSEKEKKKQKRIYELSAVGEIPSEMPLQWSFRHLTTILQLHQLDIEKTIGYYEKEMKDELDRKRLRIRATCAKLWLEKHAPDDFRFTVQDSVNVELKGLEKKAVKELAEKLKERKWTDLELHNEFYIIAKNLGLKPGDFFKAVYMVLINKEKGPRLASFILQIGKDKVIDLLEKV